MLNDYLITVYKNLESSRLRRKIIRGRAKQIYDKNEEKDGKSYEAIEYFKTRHNLIYTHFSIGLSFF